jgi:hypothetical protein
LEKKLGRNERAKTVGELELAAAGRVFSELPTVGAPTERETMDEINHSGPAFPVHKPEALPVKTVPELERAVAGMSLRQYYAGLAMQALMPVALSIDPEISASKIALDAIDMADAMICALGA